MKRFFLMTLIALLGTTANAESPEASPKILDTLSRQGISIVEPMSAPVGLQGFIGRYNGQLLEVYVTPDQDHLIVGTMLNAKGERTAEQALSAATNSGLDWAALGETHWVGEGEVGAKRVVYAFMDPNCPYCALFWAKAQPYLAQGDVELRHILVGMLHPSSTPKAATILASQSPAKAMAEHLRNMKQGGIKVVNNIADEFISDVESNTKTMKAMGIFATPAVIYKDSQGRIQQAQGLPNDSIMSQQIFFRE